MSRGRKRREPTSIVESTENAPVESLPSITESLSSSQDGGRDGDSSSIGINSGTNTGGDSDSDSDSDSGNATGEQYGIAGINDQGDRRTEGGGTESTDLRGSDRIGSTSDGSGRGNSGTRRRSRAGTDTATGQTKEGARVSDKTVPREVAFDSLGGRGKKGNDSISVEFITEGTGIVLYGIGSAFNDLDTWKAEEDDCAEFARRVHKWLNSGGSKKANAFQKWIAKNEPLIGVGMGAFALLGPRIATTLKKRKNVNLQKKAAASGTQGNGGNTTSSGAPSPEVYNGVTVAGIRTAANGNNGNHRTTTEVPGANSNGNSGNAIPLRRGDFNQVREWNDT